MLWQSAPSRVETTQTKVLEFQTMRFCRKKKIQINFPYCFPNYSQVCKFEILFFLTDLNFIFHCSHEKARVDYCKNLISRIEFRSRLSTPAKYNMKDFLQFSFYISNFLSTFFQT